MKSFDKPFETFAWHPFQPVQGTGSSQKERLGCSAVFCGFGVVCGLGRPEGLMENRLVMVVVGDGWTTWGKTWEGLLALF